MDAVSAAAVGFIAQRGQRDTQDRRIPLLGVMGAFVFGAQMVNFPVGLGTSGHLVGGALLAIVLGPSAACVVMTAILALQALILQDGGVLALGANVFNMALAGVAAGYLPYRLWGPRNAAIFASGLLSVLVSACLALGQLLISGVRMPRGAMWVSLGLFLVSAVMEGAITLAAVRGIGRLNATWVRGPEPASSRTLATVALVSLVLVVAGTLIASAAPDGIQKLTAFGLDAAWSRKALAGVMGLVLVFAVCVVGGRLIYRRRSA
jgi:cobalt/nickel transport system permease protein